MLHPVTYDHDVETTVVFRLTVHHHFTLTHLVVTIISNHTE